MSRIDGTTASVERIMAAADTVLAVWPEPSEACGVAFMIVKGAQSLEQIAQDKLARELTIEAIPCRDVAQATALTMTLGDKPN